MEKNLPDYTPDDMGKKLILLFIFEKMEFPLTDHSLAEIISCNPNWLTYMDFKESLFLLGEARFIHRTNHGTDSLFYLTDTGKRCLAHFYTKIPASVREDITAYAKGNRNRFKRSQEYTIDYYKNSDGTHTAVFRIKENQVADNLLEIRMKVPTRNAAKKATAKWRDKAAYVYESIFNTLVDEEVH
ncbi:MAG: DUF4364 family protein [Firmicutes bacterium]|nr:DUF4364 family protein [Bacillota bacterium]